MILKPMLADPADVNRLVAFVEDPHYALEPKLDGHRLLVSVHRGLVTVVNRDGERSQHTPLLTDEAHRAAYRSLPRGLDGNVVLDGELIDGVLWVFDLPVCLDNGLYPVATSTGFSHRRAVLEALFATWEPDPRLFRLVESATTQEDKARLALRIRREQGEGLMAKLLTGVYRAGGRSAQVLKLKFVTEADLVVIGLGYQSKDNAVLGVLFPNEQAPREIGRASTLGKGAIAIDDVVVVRYRHLSAGGRLVNPRIIRRRTDKPMAECTADQLVHAPTL